MEGLEQMVPSGTVSVDSDQGDYQSGSAEKTYLGTIMTLGNAEECGSCSSCCGNCTIGGCKGCT